MVSPGRAVVVDYSPTVSDVGALLYLLEHPEVEVVAVTLPVTGEAGCELGVDVTLGILAMVERTDVPVACDDDRPAHAEDWPEEFLTGHEALAFGLPDASHLRPDGRPAHQLIADVVAAQDRPVTIVAVAPLTNVARALDRHPEVRDQIAEIVIMGGAVDVPGNVPGTDAEWNLWIDVPAAAAVIASGTPVTLVPLDATNDVPVPAFWQRDLTVAPQSDSIVYLTRLVRLFPAVTSGFFYLWDELAASVGSGEAIVTTEEVHVTVSEEPDGSRGLTVRDPAGAPIVVAHAVPDPEAFYQHFLAVLAGAPFTAPAPLVMDQTTVPAEVGPDPTPQEVLGFWLIHGLLGDLARASSVVAPDARWVGFGDSPDGYVEGARPFGAFDAEVECTSVEATAYCDMTWIDLWIAAIPELDRSRLQVEAQVREGVIVAFDTLSFDEATTAAFTSQLAWLEARDPARTGAACSPDPAAETCGALLVATVQEWVDSR